MEASATASVAPALSATASDEDAHAPPIDTRPADASPTALSGNTSRGGPRQRKQVGAPGGRKDEEEGRGLGRGGSEEFEGEVDGDLWLFISLGCFVGAWIGLVLALVMLIDFEARYHADPDPDNPFRPAVDQRPPPSRDRRTAR